MRKKIQSILVPYDGTKSSEQALKSSINIAETYNSKLVLLTCIREKFTFGFFKTKTDKQLVEKQKKNARQRIERIKNYCKKLGILVKSKIIKCDIISKEIVAYAKSEKADLIVMSKTKLSSNAEKVYHESTVESVFKDSPCSFLYVR